jgi:hypothetical protein
MGPFLLETNSDIMKRINSSKANVGQCTFFATTAKPVFKEEW